MENEQKNLHSQNEDVVGENGFLDEQKVNTGLNECALALLHDLYFLSRGACFPVLQKMSQYNSFGSFVAEAADVKAIDFIPALFESNVPKDE